MPAWQCKELRTSHRHLVHTMDWDRKLDQALPMDKKTKRFADFQVSE